MVRFLSFTKTGKCVFKNQITMGSQQTYLWLPCHPRRDFWLPQCPQSILSGAHSRLCPGESFHRCPPCTTHSPAHQSSPCQRDEAECPGNRARWGGHAGLGIQLPRCPFLTSALTPGASVSFPYKTRIATTCFMSLNNVEMRERKRLSMNPTMKSMQHG